MEKKYKSVDCDGWIIFDLENNMRPEHEVKGSFYKRASRLLCVVTKEVSTGDIKVFKEGDEDAMFSYLLSSKRLVAHNGRGYDIPALGNIYPDMNIPLRSHPLIDTLVQSRNDFTNQQLSDFDMKKGYPTSKALHSLRSWGYRFGDNKIEEFKEVDWATQPCTDELVEYCTQDVNITDKLLRHLLKNKGMKVGKK